MDYKYIEQLLERYWQCETTPEEENVLRAFFAQPDVPANLARYKALFVYEQQQAADGLGENFDERLCQLAGVDKEKKTKPTVVRAKRLSFAARLQPLYRAVAILAVVLVIGNGVQYVFDSRKPVAEWDYNPDTTKTPTTTRRRLMKLSTTALKNSKTCSHRRPTAQSSILKLTLR